MNRRLKAISGPARGQEIALPESGRYILGRGKQADLKLRDPGVSKQHCIIEVSAGGIRLTDLGSRNGTTLNGAKIQGMADLSEGDELTIGHSELVLLVGDFESARTVPLMEAADESSLEETVDVEASRNSPPDSRRQLVRGWLKSERLRLPTAFFRIPRGAVAQGLGSSLDGEGSAPPVPRRTGWFVFFLLFCGLAGFVVVRYLVLPPQERQLPGGQPARANGTPATGPGTAGPGTGTGKTPALDLVPEEEPPEPEMTGPEPEEPPAERPAETTPPAFEGRTPEAVIDELVRRQQDGDPADVLEAQEQLVELGAPALVPVCRHIEDNPGHPANPALRKAALRILARQPLGDLGELVANDDEDTLSGYATMAFLQAASPEDRDYLLQMSEDSSVALRRAALRSLQGFQDPDLLTSLYPLVDTHPDLTVRLDVARTLVASGDPDARAFLEGLLQFAEDGEFKEGLRRVLGY